MDDVSWGALALSLTIIGGIYTWWALRRRGTVEAVRGAGLTLLPIAAWLTGLLPVVSTIVDSVGDWLTRLVFDPRTWLGLIVAFVAVVLIGSANLVSRRRSPLPGAPDRSGRVASKTPPSVGRAKASGSQPIVDDEMAEIQALLKRRGIS